MLRFGYSTINWGRECDLAQAAREIRAAGWDAVELFGHSLDWMGTPDGLRGRLDGLAVATLFGSIGAPFHTRAQVHVHQRRIDYAAAIGASDYGLVGGQRLRQRRPTADEYRDLARLCEELAAYGEPLGVAVAYHAHTGCTIETGPEIDTLLELSPRVKLCLDVSHVALVDEDPVEQLRRYRARTSYVHLKDWAHGHFVGLGEGILAERWPAILRELEESEFGGWVVVEQSRSDESPSAAALANAAFLRGLGHEPAPAGTAAGEEAGR